MAKTEDREPVTGRPQIQRQYEGDGPASDIGGMTREERAAKYQRDMGPQFCAELEIARSEAVKKFRKNGGEIDTKYDRWYDADDWANDGTYIGEGPCVKAPRPEKDVIAEQEARKAEARAAIAETIAQSRSGGAKPYGKSEVVESMPDQRKIDVAAKKRGAPKKGAGR